jgi:hypothetical protein
MDLELLGSLGWREGLMAVIALLVLYIIVLFFRLRRLQHGVPALSPIAAQSAVAAYAAIQEPDAAKVAAVEPVGPVDAVWASGPPASVAASESPGTADSAKPEFPWNEPPPEIPGQAMIDALQREVYQLRCEVDELRAEVLAAREDFRRQSGQSTASAQSASPLYNEAMQMAIQGHDATTIAHRCGIARAEADLVVALARNRHEGL